MEDKIDTLVLDGPVDKQIEKLVGDLAYTELTQSLLFQLDYCRDPTRVGTSEYKHYSQIAQWNNEGDSVNATLKENFVKASAALLSAPVVSVFYRASSAPQNWYFLGDWPHHGENDSDLN